MTDNDSFDSKVKSRRRIFRLFKLVLFLSLLGGGVVFFIVTPWKGKNFVNLIWRADHVEPSSAERLTVHDVETLFSDVGSPESYGVKGSLGAVLGVSSLAGTDVDGALKYDTSGHLNVDQDVKQVFEYFLSARGEVPLEKIISGFEQYSYEILPETAAAEVVELFYSYLMMKAELAELMEVESFLGRSAQSNEKLDELNNFFEIRNQIRSKHLGQAVTSAFYEDEEDYDNYQIEKAKISLDDTLGEGEKSVRLALVESTVLSPELAASIKEERDFNELISKVEILRAEDASPSEIFSVRQKVLGSEYAARMQVVDRERSEWKLRVRDYLVRRGAVLGATMSSVDKDTAINDLRSHMFSERERLRLKAYEDLLQ